jgi:hypothetical protein
MVVLLSLVSCDILRDSPFVVESWSPGSGYHADPSSIKLSLLFSHDCSKIKTEQAFSLLEDGRSVEGYFNWQGSRLIFTPVSPLEMNRDYIVSLGTGAQDKNGLSLEWKFEEEFTTRPKGNRLNVVSVVPSYNEIITEPRETFDIFFSEAIPETSCINSISFSPSLNGSWRLEDKGKTARFTPVDPWRQGGKYRISIAAGFKDSLGRSLGEDFSSVFTVAINGDLEIPKLISAWAVNHDGVETELTEAEVFEDWESFTGLRLDFSKPVDSSIVKNRINVEPNAPLVMETIPCFTDSVIFKFAEIPEWKERFVFRLLPGIRDSSGNESEEEKRFVIKTGGLFSKPPALMGMRIPLAPGGTDEHEQDIRSFSVDDLFSDLPIMRGDDRYPYASPVNTWIELYFDTALESDLNLFSLMDLFRVEATNGAISFSPRHIVDREFNQSEPETKWASYKRVEILGFLTNMVYSGVVSFVISPGLEDTRGNRNSKAMRISFLK